MARNSSRIKSFKIAGSGLRHALFTQINFQIQLFVAILVLLLAYFIGFNRYEWLILIITIGLVLIAELLNTVIEVVVDLAVQEKLLPEAKIAKDVAAAAVLLMSLISIIVGLILFWPHFF